MAPPAHTLLTSLVANALFRASQPSDNLSGETEKEEDEMLEFGGVEIIVNDGTGGHAHESAYYIYPHFEDRPPSLLGAHASYPAFENNIASLIGETVADDAVFKHDGVEMVANNNRKASCASCVHPHYADRPEGNRIGPHTLYPGFESIGGLIGDNRDDVPIEHDGIEIIPNGQHEDLYSTFSYPHIASHLAEKPHGHLLGAHALYPLFEKIGGLIGDKKDDDMIEHHGIEIIANDGACVCPSSNRAPFALYSASGENAGGLIGDEEEVDGAVESDGIEIITSNDHDDCHASCVYPHFEDRPEGNLLGGALYPAFAETPGRLIGEAAKTHTMYPAFAMNIGGLIGNAAKSDDAVEEMIDEKLGHVVNFDSVHHMDNEKGTTVDRGGLSCTVFGKFERDGVLAAVAETNTSTASFTSELPKFRGRPPEPLPVPSANKSDEDKQIASLVTLFFALPRNEVLRAMRVAISQLHLKPSMLAKLGTGFEMEHKHSKLGNPCHCMSWLITAATSTEDCYIAKF